MIKRYKFIASLSTDCNCEMREDACGNYVGYDDYALSNAIREEEKKILIEEIKINAELKSEIYDLDNENIELKEALISANEERDRAYTEIERLKGLNE